MLTKVEVRNNAGDVLELWMTDVSDGFIIEDIDGLGPVKATVVSSSFANLDGVQYQSSRREARNIVIQLALEPDYVTQTVQDLRDQLYNFFMSKAEVSLRFFMSNGLTVNIEGRVESCDPTYFAKEPGMAISILCFDPDFQALSPVVVPQSTVESSTEFMIDYPGTVESGIKFVMNVDRTLTEFTIYHRGPDNITRTMDFVAPLELDDVLTIVTIPGIKEVTLNRDSTLSSVLYGVTPQSNWIELVKGENFLRVFAVGLPVPFTIEYTPRYGGL